MTDTEGRERLPSSDPPTAEIARVDLVAGFHDVEADEESEFRWMARRGELRLAPAEYERLLELWVYSEFADQSQTLTAVTDQRARVFRLAGGWSSLQILVPADASRVTLGVNKIFPPSNYPGDARELAVRIRDPILRRSEGRGPYGGESSGMGKIVVGLRRGLASCLRKVKVKGVGVPHMVSCPPPERPRKPKGWLGPEEDALVPPRALWIGPNDPISHYYRWIWEYLAYLTLLVDLRREEAVLELGCGHGRTARGLLSYLRQPGRYTGLDVDRRRIEDAQARISLGHPAFRFVWADVRNPGYNPNGRIRADDYVFPFEDGSFDVAYAASLFTHLLPSETLNYFKQTRRVLRPGGRCLFSFFLLDYYRGRGTTVSPLYEFDVPLTDHRGVAVRDIDHPDAVVGYSLESLRDLCQKSGLNIERVVPGLWSENPGWAVHEQDLVVLSRASETSAEDRSRSSAGS